MGGPMRLPTNEVAQQNLCYIKEETETIASDLTCPRHTRGFQIFTGLFDSEKLIETLYHDHR